MSFTTILFSNMRAHVHITLSAAHIHIPMAVAMVHVHMMHRVVHCDRFRILNESTTITGRPDDTKIKRVEGV